MLALLISQTLAKPTFTFDVRPTLGLTISVNEVPIVRGSFFQYLPGHYSSRWNTQKVTTEPDGTVRLEFSGAEGKASGWQTYRQSGDRLKVRYRFDWKGENAAQVELANTLFAPAFATGEATSEGTNTRLARVGPFTKGESVSQRKLTADSRSISLDAPLANVEITSSIPLILFDGRGFEQEWAKKEPLWWLGALGLEVRKDKSLEFELDFRITPKALAPARERTAPFVSWSTQEARAVDESIPSLIPKPVSDSLNFDRPTLLRAAVAYSGRNEFRGAFENLLGHRFAFTSEVGSGAAFLMDSKVADLGKRSGAYRIIIRNDSAEITGQDEYGLAQAGRRLASLVFAKKGSLWLPTGIIEDEPQTYWRGVHLFVGPTAREFHQRLWERVLLPMGFNKVVLQCERTQWQSTPIDPRERPMERAELGRLFDDYRSHGVEPIPLIQSFGHMGWFFAGNRRLDLAYNSDLPFTIDPRNPATEPALRTLWSEVIEVTKPKTIHFGCDEIDMRGFNPVQPSLTTALWERMMPILGGIASNHGKEMMIWGDKLLAPGEAVDAAHGHTTEDAARRRASVPKGTYIADWHYREDPRPEVFLPNLQRFKSEGLKPIASTWFRPENIRGFNLAAISEGVGTLQTTWAGYESNESNMLKNLDQFTAMVLSGDIAWSGRKDALGQLGYDPADVFRRMYFSEPSPTKAVEGKAFGTQGASETRIGNFTFRVGSPTLMRSILDPNLANAPTSLVIPVKTRARFVAIALDCLYEAADGDDAAVLEVEVDGGQPIKREIRYGHHLRASTDARVVPFADRKRGIGALNLDLGALKNVRSMRVVSKNPTLGIRIHAVTTY